MQTAHLDLFAGIPVADYAAPRHWNRDKAAWSQRTTPDHAAIYGLLFEITFIATFTQRFFAR